MKNVFTFLFVIITSITFAQTTTYTWEQRVSGFALGDPICVDKSNTDRVFCGFDNKIYKSLDRGETFSDFGNVISGSNKIKNIILHPTDTATVLVAIEDSPQRIVKTTDNGATWVTKGNFDFAYFGIPMTPDHQNGELIYTMSENHFIRSTDFAETWDTVSYQTSPNFGTPCDIEVFPDSANIILVGNNNGGIYRTSDYGLTWDLVHSTSGEIPTIAISEQESGAAFATKWSGGGGFLKSTDYGKTWNNYSWFSGLSMWGVDVSPTDPNFIMVGKYSGSRIDISLDGGQNFEILSVPGNNYSVYIVDNETVFAAQSNGLYKLIPPDVVPVELTSFNLSFAGEEVILNWSTATETNNSGFAILKSTDNVGFERIGFVDGAGTSESTNNYSFSDKELNKETAYYRLKQIDFDGTYSYSEIKEIIVEQPSTFALEQNYPNPFNPSTTIRFTLSEASDIQLEIYNSLGQLVKKYNEFANAGTNEINFNASSLTSGIYFYKLESKGEASTFTSKIKKMILLK